MPAISPIVSALSADVVPKLASVGINLTTGAILTGRRHLNERLAAPLIVFVPLKSAWGPREAYNRSPLQGAPTPEMVKQWQQRSILTELQTFEVHVIGQSVPADPDAGDFDVTQTMYQQLVASTHLMAVGSYQISGGEFVDQKSGAAQVNKAGHEFVFQITFKTPVLDIVLPLVPTDTGADATITLDTDGTGQ